MDMSGKITIAAPQEKVWQALNDEKILQNTVPGCREIVRVDETHFTAKVQQKIGPISTSFTGEIELTDLDPPSGYTISGSGDGGSVGFAKGGAKVRLTSEADGTTTLTYEVKAQVGGKIAQLGARLIDSTAKKLADQFFRAFKNEVEEPAESAETAALSTTASVPEPASSPASPPVHPSAPPGHPGQEVASETLFGLPRWLVLVVAAAAILMILWLLAGNMA